MQTHSNSLKDLIETTCCICTYGMGSRYCSIMVYLIKMSINNVNLFIKRTLFVVWALNFVRNIYICIYIYIYIYISDVYSIRNASIHLTWHIIVITLLVNSPNGRRKERGWCGGIYMSSELIVEHNGIIDVYHTMDLRWEKFQWILPLYMEPISFQSMASVVCSVTGAIFIDFCPKKLNVFFPTYW